MKRVPIDQVVRGMVLAKAVTNAAGLVVLSAGIELTEATIARLETMGVTAVYVEGAPGEEGTPVKTLAELDRELDQRFRNVAADPIQTRIREAVRRHLHATHAVDTGAGEKPSTCPD